MSSRWLFRVWFCTLTDKGLKLFLSGCEALLPPPCWSLPGHGCARHSWTVPFTASSARHGHHYWTRYSLLLSSSIYPPVYTFTSVLSQGCTSVKTTMRRQSTSVVWVSGLRTTLWLETKEDLWFCPLTHQRASLTWRKPVPWDKSRREPEPTGLDLCELLYYELSPSSSGPKSTKGGTQPGVRQKSETLQVLLLSAWSFAALISVYEMHKDMNVQFLNSKPTMHKRGFSSSYKDKWAVRLIQLSVKSATVIQAWITVLIVCNISFVLGELDISQSNLPF